jgi:hypothetical protein
MFNLCTISSFIAYLDPKADERSCVLWKLEMADVDLGEFCWRDDCYCLSLLILLIFVESFIGECVVTIAYVYNVTRFFLKS